MTRLAPAPSRIVIEDLAPQVAGGRFPVKRVVGEPVDVTATVLADGHDHLAVAVAHRPPGAKGWTEEPMVAVNPGLDRWQGRFVPDAVGSHRFRVRAWIDEVATWRDGTRRKFDAGLDLTSELLSGAALLEGLAETGPRRAAATLMAAADALRRGDRSVVSDDEQGAALEAAARHALRPGEATASSVVEVDVEMERALFSTWYELFPRSVGTLADVGDHLDELAELGIDVLYLPPVHPIGETHRKGPDNCPGAGPGDPGSPWAIGSAAGGHTAVHPDLGTVADVAALAAAADERGIALALDLAFQCSPDHPWVTEHPAWFRHRPDGTIQYAENPPKVYQDIYPLDFETSDWRALWDELLAVTRFWCDQGVTVFRVDNPHTKPFAFWQWLIGEVRAGHPGTIFLAEAFTRPEVMRRLGQLGFTQGYTYFTWRASGRELAEYFTRAGLTPVGRRVPPQRLAHHSRHPAGAPPERPLGGVRRAAGPGRHPVAQLRRVRAQLRAGRERARRRGQGGAGRLGEVRGPNLGPHDGPHPAAADGRDQPHPPPSPGPAHLADPALPRQRQRSVAVLLQDGPPGALGRPGRPCLGHHVVVVNLDPLGVQRGTIWFDPRALGLDPDRPFEVVDLLGGHRFAWQGGQAFIELDPARQPAHVFRVSQPDDDESAEVT